MVLKMNMKRKALIKNSNSQREVRWQDIVKAARVAKGHRSTVKRAFDREKIPVAARRLREKPQRSKEHAKERRLFCEKWGSKPPSYYVKDVDLIIDNKRFDIPTTERARQHLAQQQVRFHLRTPGEGLKPEFTKPGRKKNRMNTGSTVVVCAGISNGKVVLWHYLKNWNGEVAASLYRKEITKVLRKQQGRKRSYDIIEDNDPTGYKSGAAKAAKTECKIKALPMPRYSPDLNPLDYCIWHEIERRMVENNPKSVETVVECKKRLRATALRLPKALVVKAVRAMPSRMRAVARGKGYNIAED